MTGRKFIAAPLLVLAGLAIALPAHSQSQNQQQQDQPSQGEQILGRILDRLIGPAPQQPDQPQQQALTMAEVLAHPRRGADGARDQYRHPAETVAFFRVEPGMTVVDYMPNGWWYSRILVPYLGRSGRYIGMNPDVSRETGYLKNTYDNVAEKLAAEHAKWASYDDAAVTGFNTQDYPQGLDGTVDRVLIFREMHNQFRYGWLNADMLAIRRMLKPDGLVGIVDHRMYEDAPFSMTDGNKGYLRQSDVIDLMDAYGFDLVATSEINANPKDPKNWRIGVWELPPTYAGAPDEAERQRRAAIGESDRMTLLFRKRD